MRRFLIALAFVLAMPIAAFALCTTNAAVGATSTQIIGTTAITGGRKYLSVQNVGTVTIDCTYGSVNAASSANTFQLTTNEMYEYPLNNGLPPQGDVACYAPAGTGAATACEN